MRSEFLKQKWIERAGQKADWSWLETKRKFGSIESLYRSEVPPYLIDLYNVFGFNETDVVRASNRMVMGAMRYGRLVEKNYEKMDTRVLVDRVMSDTTGMLENYECVYDAVNHLFLLILSGKVNQGDANAMADAISIGKQLADKFDTPYLPKDRK